MARVRGVMDVYKNRNRALIANRIRRGDECERRDDDLISLANAQSADAKMQTCGS